MLSRPISSCIFTGPRRIHRLCFHTHVSRLADNSHYEVLDLPQSATATDVKRRFYELSKTHHPDRNRNDPQAASRFVKISTAYAVLRNVQSREKYDHELRQHSKYRNPGGSSGPAGSRPASGLSRRRTQFKGPPPSFFRNGGWSTFKGTPQPNPQRGTSGTTAGGFGVGGSTSGQNDDVPHFDFAGKYREQERRRREKTETPRAGIAPSIIVPVLAVTAILIVTVSSSGIADADKKGEPSKAR